MNMLSRVILISHEIGRAINICAIVDDSVLTAELIIEHTEPGIGLPFLAPCRWRVGTEKGAEVRAGGGALGQLSGSSRVWGH